MVTGKHTQAEANYGKGDPIDHCGICRFYRTPGSCSAVMGAISPFGVCDLMRAVPSPFPKTMSPAEMNAVRAMAADATDRSGQVMGGQPGA